MERTQWDGTAQWHGCEQQHRLGAARMEHHQGSPLILVNLHVQSVHSSTRSKESILGELQAHKKTAVAVNLRTCDSERLLLLDDTEIGWTNSPFNTWGNHDCKGTSGATRGAAGPDSSTAEEEATIRYLQGFTVFLWPSHEVSTQMLRNAQPRLPSYRLHTVNDRLQSGQIFCRLLLHRKWN